MTWHSLFAVSVLVSALGAVAEAQVKPNIVIIYADDLGYGDVSCYNTERGKIRTPHIDGLAAQGMRFTDAHSSSGVCSPSRYTLLTGRYHWRTRLQRGIVGVWGKPLIAPDRITVASMLKQNGYRTACVGKWHLGWDWPITAQEKKLLGGSKSDPVVTEEQRAVWKTVFAKPIGGGPTTRGFDEYFGTDVPNWPPYCFIENDRTIGIPSEFLPARLFENNQASVQGPALAGWKLEPILPALGDRAAKFITEAAQETEPYFLYMPLTAPHTPLSVNEEWLGESGLNLYADFVMETDAVIGRVLAAIEQSGEADRTVVILTSDNGCAPYVGAAELEKLGHYPSGPLRGYKSDVWEGGHRVAFVVRWPGVVSPGTTCDQLVHQADILATCASMAGVDVPATAGEDSFNLRPLLEGRDIQIREHAVSHSSSGLPSIRRGQWKLIFGPGSGGWAKGKDAQRGQLYHLGDDPFEQDNLVSRPGHAARLTKMKELLRREIAKLPHTFGEFKTR